MRPFHRAVCLILCLAVGLSPCFTASVYAANTEETKLLLQKGLNVYEVDQELARIEKQENNLIHQLTTTEQELLTQLALSSETRVHAAKVLRAYYMGDRDSLWMLIFSITSFKDALSTFEYLQMIIRNDRESLKRYTDNQKRLSELTASLYNSKTQLQQTKERYLAQREKLIQLQKQLDEDLSKHTEAAAILQQMTNLTVQWQDKGIPLFKMYFQSLAQAMKQLPEIISDQGNGKSNHLIINDFQQYTFQITDQELNRFLRSKNELFRNMTFRFTDSYVLTTGTQDGMEVLIKGKYELAVKEEPNKKAFVRFRIEQLQFNGYDLPASTIEAMEKEFDLGIYPQNLAAFLLVTGVKLEEGKLSLMLKLAL
jgi:peptidoglycan hydrolase CwlO-like protein